MKRLLIISFLAICGSLLFFDIKLRLTAYQVTQSCEASLQEICAPCQEILDGKRNSK
jgi:hypothetical protein